MAQLDIKEAQDGIQEAIRQLSEYYIRSFEEMFESQTLE